MGLFAHATECAEDLHAVAWRGGSAGWSRSIAVLPQLSARRVGSAGVRPDRRRCQCARRRDRHCGRRRGLYGARRRGHADARRSRLLLCFPSCSGCSDSRNLSASTDGLAWRPAAGARGGGRFLRPRLGPVVMHDVGDLSYPDHVVGSKSARLARLQARATDPRPLELPGSSMRIGAPPCTTRGDVDGHRAARAEEVEDRAAAQSTGSKAKGMGPLRRARRDRPRGRPGDVVRGRSRRRDRPRI